MLIWFRMHARTRLSAVSSVWIFLVQARDGLGCTDVSVGEYTTFTPDFPVGLDLM